MKARKQDLSYLTSASKRKIKKTINSLAALGIYEGAKAKKSQSPDVQNIRILEPKAASGIKKLINPNKRRNRR